MNFYQITTWAGLRKWWADQCSHVMERHRETAAKENKNETETPDGR